MCDFGILTKFQSHYLLQDALDIGPLKHTTLLQACVTCALTNWGPVHSAADNNFEIQSKYQNNTSQRSVHSAAYDDFEKELSV